MHRAIHGRVRGVSDLPPGYSINLPAVRQSSHVFQDSKEEVEKRHDPKRGKMTPAGAGKLGRGLLLVSVFTPSLSYLHSTKIVSSRLTRFDITQEVFHLICSFNN